MKRRAGLQVAQAAPCEKKVLPQEPHTETDFIIGVVREEGTWRRSSIGSSVDNHVIPEHSLRPLL